jgi:hypothetical protein
MSILNKKNVKKKSKPKSLKICDYYEDSYVETRHNENISEKNLIIKSNNCRKYVNIINKKQLVKNQNC